jgi:ketosteroid isomerase-like protein
MNEANIVDRFFGSMRDCDTAVVRDCLTEDAVVWHNFDRIAMNVDDVVRSWEAMGTNFVERGVVDVRRQQTPSGYVQQHLLVVRLKDGARKAWPVCIVVQLRGEKIARIDEYIDVSESHDPGEGGSLSALA